MPCLKKCDLEREKILFQVFIIIWVAEIMIFQIFLYPAADSRLSMDFEREAVDGIKCSWYENVFRISYLDTHP